MPNTGRQRMGDLPKVFRRGFFAECREMLDRAGTEPLALSQGRFLYDLGMGDFLIGYPSKTAREKAEAAFARLDLANTPLLQAPAVWTHFSHDDKEFLPLAAAEHLDGPTNDCLYKWVVVDPELFSLRLAIAAHLRSLPEVIVEILGRKRD